MTDREFIQYCRAHSETPRALFSREDYERICGLSGTPLAAEFCPDFVRIDRWAMRPLCDKAELLLQIAELTAERDVLKAKYGPLEAV